MSEVLIADWGGLLKNCRADQCDLFVDAILLAMSDERGGSVPFQVRATDGERYWSRLDTPREGLDYNELLRVADALENLTVSELKAVLCAIPASWPVSDRELETLGFFFDSRRAPVARRIRQLAATLAG